MWYNIASLLMKIQKTTNSVSGAENTSLAFANVSVMQC